MPSRPARRFAPLAASTLVLCSAAFAPPAGAAADPPRRWDPQVRMVADEVEDIRGLEFEHPVPVRFLSDRAFRRRVTSEEQDLTKREKRELRTATETLRALGLVDGDLDLLDAVNEVQGSDVLAYYDPKEKDVVVRGKGDLDAPRRATLAHELAHVLQDQHYDLTKLQERAEDRDRSLTALDALVEGDASWVGSQYSERTGDRDEAEAGGDPSSPADETPRDAAVPRGDVPAIIEVIFAAPYLLGEPLIDALRAHDGADAVHDAFRDPPRTDAQIFDPSEVLLNRTPAEVRAPKLGRGERRLDQATEFGAFGLYFLLAGRVPAADAFRATSGLSGDRMVTYRHDGTTCVRAAFRGRSGAMTGRIRDALEAWAATVPDASADIGDRGRDVLLTACDPGQSVAAPEDERLRTAMTVLYVRNTVLADVLEQGAPPEFAACAADEYSTDPRVIELAGAQAELDEATQDELARAASRAGEQCRHTVD